MAGEWVKQKTKPGDTLALLIAEYGVSLNDILRQNNIVPPSDYTDSYINKRWAELGLPSTMAKATAKKIITENDINEWVHGLGGSCMDFQPGSTTDMRKLKGCPSGGWAVFNAATIIALPNTGRREVAKVAGPAELPGSKLPAVIPTKATLSFSLSRNAKIGIAVGSLAALGLFAVASSSPKKKGRATASAAA